MLDRDPHTALLAAKSHLAALHVLRAVQVLIDLTRKEFDPDQPRAPAGGPEGGQWISIDEDIASDFEDELLQTPTIGDDSEKPQEASRRRTGPTGTPAQEARLTIATGQAREAVSRVMDLDPTWRGPSSIIGVGDIEGQIAHQEAVAAAATARYQEILRSGYGSNSTRAFEPDPVTAREAITAYRNNYTTRDYDLVLGRGTIAIGSIDRDPRPLFGVNSMAPGYTPDDRAAADLMRDNLILSDADIMRSDNIGYKPNDALYHAEATALMRAARMNGGSLYGKYVELYVDRRLCESCEDVLPIVTRELGYPTVRFRDAYGNIRTLRRGRWE